MKNVVVKPVEIIGKCPIGINLDCEIMIDGLKLTCKNNKPICFDFIAQISHQIWLIKGGRTSFFHASCPGCIKDLDNENRVIVLIADADKRELGEVFTEYWRLRDNIGETDLSKELRLESDKLEKSNKYDEALIKMHEALKQIKVLLDT